MANLNYVDPNKAGTMMDPAIISRIKDQAWAGGQPVDTGEAKLNAREDEGWIYSPGGGGGSYGESGDGVTKAFTKDGGGFSYRNGDGLFDAYDSQGKYLETSNGNNKMTAKDWITFAAVVAGAYYAAPAAGGTEAVAAGGADAATSAAWTQGASGLGADTVAAVGGNTAAAGAGATNAMATAGLSAAEQVAAYQAAGLTQAEIAALVPEAMAPGTMAASSGVGTELVKEGVKEAAKSTLKDAVVETGKEAAEKGFVEQAGDFITRNKLAPTLVNLGAGIIGRVADAKEQQRQINDQRQRYQTGYQSGSGLSLWRSKSKKTGG